MAEGMSFSECLSSRQSRPVRRCEVLHHNHDPSSALRQSRNVDQHGCRAAGQVSICRVSVCPVALPSGMWLGCARSSARGSRRCRWASPLSLTGGLSRDDARRDRSGHARRHRCRPRCRGAVFRDHGHAPGGWPMELLRALTAARYWCRRTACVCYAFGDIKLSAGLGVWAQWQIVPVWTDWAVVVDAMAAVGFRRWRCRWVRRRSRRRGPGPGRVGVWCRCGAPGGVGRRTCAAGPGSVGWLSPRRRGPACRGAAGRGR